MPNYQAILSGQSWNALSGLRTSRKPVFLTYTFNPSQWDSSKFGSADKAMARKALKMWGDASGIRFIEVKGSEAEITFQWQWQWQTVTAWAEFPELTRTSSDGGDLVRDGSGGNVYLNTQHRAEMAKNPSFKLYILLHELGHALGLKHPFHKMTHNKKLLGSDLDHVKHTVMSYTGGDVNMQSAALGPLDIQAIRALYGSPSQDGRQVAKWSWSKSKQVLTQVGKSQADLIYGVAVGDAIHGGRGNDRLYGLGGEDTLLGGTGNDILSGGNGDDLLDGDIGNDALKGGYGSDTLQGGTGSDVLNGGDGDDSLYGNVDNDALNGGEGGDVLHGDIGNDVLDGGIDNDSLHGGAGSDVLTGGEGSDHFVFDTFFNGVDDVDVIADFGTSWGYDRIVLSSLVFTGLTKGYLGSAAFVQGPAATEADDRIVFNQTQNALYYDLDGSGPTAALRFAQFLSPVSLDGYDFFVV
ncbi:matrixin family metalloprotease [Microvirga arsenatis]|uniref:Matrixin family metalloprotease n=1 Tax=Microvirga arsenatis TaxID=2692265 RepID=A0ABW9Z578_9HYPH|nr:matrixin family metalloprotease [Microvirga arsenatis]NBJ13529.1 matrixin family metalloprotease [Microvirga arsenatis]NBJ26388.1 matrixin family metalloprotease [Microvirga arsenatis]